MTLKVTPWGLARRRVAVFLPGKLTETYAVSEQRARQKENNELLSLRNRVKIEVRH
jgi:hypothetical protein